MSNQNYEVELRAIVPQSQIERLRKYCAEHGSFTGTDRRFFVDYSTFLESVESRSRDIRVRSTNGRREIIIKKGGLGSNGRLEAGLFLEPGTPLRQMLTVMALMGFEKGVAGIRTVHRYQLTPLKAAKHNIEIAFQEANYYYRPDEIHSHFVEVEIMTTMAGQSAAEEVIRSVFSELQLQPFATNEFFAYIHLLNTEANGIFDFTSPNWPLIAQIGDTM